MLHRSAPQSSRRLHGAFVAAAVLAAMLPFVAVLPAGAVSRPRAPGFSKALQASPSEFPPRGGLTTLTATVSGATSCSLVIAPPVAGVPSRVSCSKTGVISVRVSLPANPTPDPVIYHVTLSATDGTATAVSPATIKVEGYRWLGRTAQHAVPGLVTAESCANPNDFPLNSHFSPPCIEVSRDGEAASLTKSGSHWTDVDGAVPLVAASCVPGSADFCVVLDANGDYLIFNRTTWTAPAPLASSGGVPLHLMSIECGGLPAAQAFANQCVASDASGHAVVATFGSTTTVVTSSVGLAGPTRVACTTPELCMVVDEAGMAVVRRGGTWSRPVRIDPGAHVDGASCTADRHTCVVVGDNGSIVSFELRGASPVRFTRTLGSSLVGGRVSADGVACAMSYCLVVLSNGVLVQGVGERWHRAGTSIPLHAGDGPIGIAAATSATTVWCSVVTHGWRTAGGDVAAVDEGPVIPVI